MDWDDLRIFHAIAEAGTLAGTAQFFESLGLPGFTAYMVFAAETLWAASP